MNELTNEKTMTVKEMAEFFGKTTKTIYRYLKELDFVVENGKEFRAKKYVVEQMAIRIYPQSPRWIKDAISNSFDLDKVPMSNVKVDNDRLNRLESMVEKLVTITTSLIQNQSAKQLEYKQDYFSVIGYANHIGYKDITYSESVRLSFKARQLSQETSKEIRKIPDERWGTVNSYSIEILERVFEI
jgi:transcriptional antiterminator